MPVNYELPREVRIKMQQDEPAVKAAIARIANEKFGITTPPRGIGKYEGGVRVNNLEIAIKDSYVMEDWRRSGKPLPEEQAVVDAINLVGAIVQASGTSKLVEKYGRCDVGDPLRCLTLT